MATRIEEENLIKANLGLVKSIVYKFKPKNADEFDEYYQIGQIALLYAIRKHDPEKGKLTTIAYNRIRWNILREYLKNKKYESGIDYQVAEFDSYSDTDKQGKETTINNILEGFSGIRLEILNLKFENLSTKEIADKVGITTGEVRKIYKEIIKKLKYDL